VTGTTLGDIHPGLRGVVGGIGLRGPHPLIPPYVQSTDPVHGSRVCEPDRVAWDHSMETMIFEIQDALVYKHDFWISRIMDVIVARIRGFVSFGSSGSGFLSQGFAHSTVLICFLPASVFVPRHCERTSLGSSSRPSKSAGASSSTLWRVTFASSEG
jgi:hypothetical protein